MQLRVQAFFYRRTREVERLAMVREFNVRYIFWGPADGVLGDWTPEDSPFVRRIYQQGGYWIGEVGGAP